MEVVYLPTRALSLALLALLALPALLALLGSYTVVINVS